MTSQINYGIINNNFPVPGADNDSNGFRENFLAISTALAVAKTEITQLQTNAIISADLAFDAASMFALNALLGCPIIYIHFVSKKFLRPLK